MRPSPNPQVIPGGAPLSPSGWGLVLVAAAAALLVAQTANADLWYEHYARAETALENENWALAVKEINEAIERKGDSGARVRSYGMKVIPYFPYFKLGIAYYHLGQFNAALQAFETETKLGAIAQSEAASAELDKYRELVQKAQAAATAEEQQRIDRIVEQSLADARDFESRGLLDEAITALDKALAVAPDNIDAQDAMSKLRAQFAQRERERERDERAAALVEDGRALLREHRYGEASSLFRQALSLKPSSDTQVLLDDSQDKLLTELEGSQAFENWHSAIANWLGQAQDLESADQPAAALDRLQAVLALEPSNQQAQTMQARLLSAQKESAAQSARRAAIGRLLSEAESQLETGKAEQSLSAANRVLALDPGNAIALKYIAQAYESINEKLLGTASRGKIPPAIRFADLRQEGEDGSLVQTVNTPDFQLNGIVIDSSPVDLVFHIGDRKVDAEYSSQPLGDFFITEFKVKSRLAPGNSTFRLTATDSESLASSSDYAVSYARPFYKSPWFFSAPLMAFAAFGGAVLLQRFRQREQLRTRRFNPYVAGAPVHEGEMFFGRKDLVDRILQTIHNNSLLIYGERRIGKTSIQHQLKKRLNELEDPLYKFYPVYVDLQGVPETQFFQTIAEDMYQELRPVLDGPRPAKSTSGDYSYRDFVADVRAALKTLQMKTSRKVRLVLLIDEVDELNDYDPRINQKLRSLFMKSFAENLVTVVSGVEIKKTWEREGSPWYNFFEEIEVKPFSSSEARELIERPISSMFKLDVGVTETIITLTAGKPYLIQKFCIALVTRLHEQRRRKITMADVEAVAQANGY